jgi:hypothetical protein
LEARYSEGADDADDDGRNAHSCEVSTESLHIERWRTKKQVEAGDDASDRRHTRDERSYAAGLRSLR